MPYAAKRPCNKPGCKALVSGSYCEDHQKQNSQDYERTRPNAYQRGYGRRWAKLRRMILARDIFCQECSTPEHPVGAIEVDHIIPRSKGGTEDESNLQGLCKRCHSSKTAKEDGRWGKRQPAQGGAGAH